MFSSALVIDGRKEVRTAIRSSLKELGVSNCQNTESVKEALQVLAASGELPEWIIVRIEAENTANKTTYDLLLSILEDKKFAKVRVSLLYDQEQLEHLPPMFEMGVLSSHKGPYTQQSLTSEFRLLFDAIAKHKPNLALVAGRYLRDHLSSSENFAELVELERSLFASFPKNQQVILHLIEAMYMNGDIEGAKNLLRQAKYLGKDIQLGVKQLEDMLDMGEEKEETISSFGKVFGINHCLIVEGDSICASQIENILISLGVEKVAVIDDGQKALDYVSANPKIDLIIQEWRFPGISGPQFLQRMRRERRFLNPIVVVSSLLKQDDILLLNEMGADCVIEKPVNSDEFVKTLMGSIRHSKFPNEAKVVARQIRVAIEANKFDEAKELYKKFLGFKDIPEGIRLLVEAEIAYINKDYKLAKQSAMESIKHKGESMVGLNILGKSLMKIGDSESAERVFARANQMNPKNIERLCLLAESQAEAGNADAANETINRAKTLDPTNLAIQEVVVNIALVTQDTATAKSIMKDMTVFTGVVAYMNNRAVLLAQEGRSDEGVKLYQNAIESLPPGNHREEGVLLYNLGLALLRQNKLKKAIEILAKISSKHGNSKLESALRLIENAKMAIKKNVPINFSTVSVDAETSSGFRRPVAYHAKPGELGLHHIFHAAAFEEKRFQSYLKRSPDKSSRQKAS